jgi:hypothetical protein
VNGQIRTSLITDPADGRLPPLTPEARARTAARAADVREHPADGPENRSLAERCLAFNAGPPMVPGPYNNYVQIFQMPGYVIIATEMIPRRADHPARWPPACRRRRAVVAGRFARPWEGDTLVIDTTNFNGRTSFRGADEHLHLVERFKRVDPTTLLYEFTVDDPSAFTRPVERGGADDEVRRPDLRIRLPRREPRAGQHSSRRAVSGKRSEAVAAMSLLGACQWLAETHGSAALRESLYMYPLIESLTS